MLQKIKNKIIESNNFLLPCFSSFLQCNFRSLDNSWIYNLRMPNGTFKTSAKHRLDWSNYLISSYCLSGDKENCILDVAVSSGEATIDLYNYLSKQKIKFFLVATELYDELELSTFLGWQNVLVGLVSGQPVMYQIGKISVRAKPTLYELIGLRLLVLIVSKILFIYFRKFYQHKITISLFSNRFRNSLSWPNIEYINNDIMDLDIELVGRFNIIRVANILNPSYFSASQSVKILSNLFDYLCHNGTLFLIKCSSLAKEDSILCVRKCADGLNVEHCSGDAQILNHWKSVIKECH